MVVPSQQGSSTLRRRLVDVPENTLVLIPVRGGHFLRCIDGVKVVAKGRVEPVVKTNRVTVLALVDVSGDALEAVSSCSEVLLGSCVKVIGAGDHHGCCTEKE